MIDVNWENFIINMATIIFIFFIVGIFMVLNKRNNDMDREFYHPKGFCECSDCKNEDIKND